MKTNLVTKEEVREFYNELSKEERKMMHADAVFEGSRVFGWAEDQYAGGALCSPLINIWTRFKNEDKFDCDEYTEIYNEIEELYYQGIREDNCGKTYDEIKKSVKKIEGWIDILENTSIHYMLDNPEDYKKDFENLLNTFDIAPLPYKTVELYWLNKVLDIYLDSLYHGWYDDFMANGFDKMNGAWATAETLKRLGVNVSERDIFNNKECYRKILLHLIPSNKFEFSKICRPILKEHSVCFKL